MKNQTVSTTLGAVILVIIAIIITTLSWKIVKNREVTETSQKVTTRQQKPVEKNQAQQNQDGKIVSEAKDKNGCRNAAGFFWCDKTQSCVQNWNETCGNTDVLDISKWTAFNSKEHGSKFSFSLKFPSSWFNPTDVASDSAQIFPLYLKNDYTETCKPSTGSSLMCSNSGHIASISIFSSTFSPREVKYDNEKKTPTTIDGYKGFIIEGVVNDANGGYVADNGQREIQVIFSDIRGEHFQIIMKLENDSDKDIFNKIISTLKFTS